MLKKLNRWQRFWALFAAVFLVSTGSLIAILWPQREPGIVADLRAPECQEWRAMPDGVFPDRYPESNERCDSIRSFLYEQRVTLRTEDDYEAYLAGTRAKTALTALAVWAGFSAGTYLLGWSSGWVVSALLRMRNLKNQ